MTKQFTAKCPYGKNYHGEVFLRRIVLTAICPYGEVSVRRSVRTAKCLTAKYPTAKSPTAKSLVTERSLPFFLLLHLLSGDM